MDRCSNSTEMLHSMRRITLIWRKAPIPPFVRNQFGASIGGPLVHDRTFFFANYEGFREVHASTAIASVPDALAHQGLLPSANNPDACSEAAPTGCVAVSNRSSRYAVSQSVSSAERCETMGTEPGI